MDPVAIAQLSEAGVDATLSKFLPSIPIRVDERRLALPLSEEVPVLAGKTVTLIHLKNVQELFAGNAQPPDFSKGPTPEYAVAFALIEMTALEYCRVSRKAERDMEFHRIYAHLRRRPDGDYPHPIFSYLRAAMRLYMSLRDLSQAEFEGIVGRLSRSAKHFALSETSTNYIGVLARTLPASDDCEAASG